MTFTCKKHGITFQQTAYKHLRGHKQCPECLREDNVERSLMETSEFIERANKTHNNRYSHDKVDTKNRDENGKVTITCPIHGDYQQNPISEELNIIKSSHATLTTFTPCSLLQGSSKR